MGVHAAGTAAGWGQGLPGGPQLPPHHATTVTAPPGVQAAPPPPPPPAQMMAYPMQQFQVTITLSIRPVYARASVYDVLVYVCGIVGWLSPGRSASLFTYPFASLLSLLRSKAISSVAVLACKCCTWKLDSISKRYRRHVCRGGRCVRVAYMRMRVPGAGVCGCAHGACVCVRIISICRR